MDNSIKYIPISELIPGEFHPHLENINDNLDNLINSIKSYGILVPLIVRPKENQYEIILGNRRYKAAKILGIEKIPVIIFNVNDEKALEIIISDNIQRKELSSKEEALLYNKALEYPNTSKEKLSINLGIPLDRITSKLNLLRKDKPKINNDLSQKENSNNYDLQNNSINSDIINISELNKEEKEREDFTMNNNQFINNNMSQNPTSNQGVTTTSEPTFGGRFFPSLEDEPTNMNLNTGFNTMDQTPNPIPLIDLTDLSAEQPVQNQNFQQPSVQIQQTDLNKPNPMPEINGTSINVEQNTVPTPPIIETNNMASNPVDLNISNNIPTDINNSMLGINNTPNVPPVDISQTIPNFQNSINQEPMPIQDINPTSNINNENYQATQTIETPIPNINIDNMPNLNTSQNINDQIASPIYVASSTTQEQKDVLPVINMIKNLAISIESLGYKLNITEDDNQTSYKINIEIEK